jgi:hypothetical protein
MAAFHVVCINLEFWFRIDFRMVRQEQVVIGLIRIGAIRALEYDCLPVEYTT